MGTGDGRLKEEVLSSLLALYREGGTFLSYTKDYEFLFAVILSAQATDRSVNEATKKLFRDLPSLSDYTRDKEDILVRDIRTIGLYNGKKEAILGSAKILREQYQGKVPDDRKALLSLPGVGYKVSGVVLDELYHHSYIPVDTHVYRVTRRIGLVPASYSPEKTEERLEKVFQGENGFLLHQRLILLGRNICHAKNPQCLTCPLLPCCRFGKKNQKSGS
ncbi:MAG: endonuclease III [Bacilli bacterium]